MTLELPRSSQGYLELRTAVQGIRALASLKKQVSHAMHADWAEDVYRSERRCVHRDALDRELS
jgi:hypothetical protein